MPSAHHSPVAAHLFGLVRSSHLNGCCCRLIDDEPDATDRQTVEVTLPDGRLQFVRVRPYNVGRRASEEHVTNVLSSEDLATHIIMSYKDQILLSMGTHDSDAWRPPCRAAHKVPDLAALAPLAAINRAFARAVHADQLWRSICAVRWMCKWGFQARMHRAQGSGWRAAYMAEEQDAKRRSIEPGELHGLRFDLRPWLVPMGIDSCFDTGLRQSQSQAVRLVPGDVEGGHATPIPVAAQGLMLGHPDSRSSERSIAWFLDEDGRGIRWGYLPTLELKGEVRRLPSWGWEICNPNVCLRALDMDGGDGELAVLENSEDLWRDLLDSLQTRRFKLPPETRPPRGRKGLGMVPGNWSIPGCVYPRMHVDESLDPPPPPLYV